MHVSSQIGVASLQDWPCTGCTTWPIPVFSELVFARVNEENSTSRGSCAVWLRKGVGGGRPHEVKGAFGVEFHRAGGQRQDTLPAHPACPL